MAFTYDPSAVNAATVEIWRQAGLNPVPFDGSNFQNPSGGEMSTAIATGAPGRTNFPSWEPPPFDRAAWEAQYYQKQYPNMPSVQAQTVMASGQGQPQNTLQNFGPATGVSVDPNAFNENWKYYYGTDFNPAALGMTAVPGSNGQYVTRSGGTFSQPGQTSSPSSSAEYDARLRMQQQQLQQAINNQTPEALAYLQHFQTNQLPVGYANPQTEVNQLLSMGLDPRGSSYLNGPAANYFSNLGIQPSGATGLVNTGQLSTPPGGTQAPPPDPSKPPDPPSGPPTGGPQWVQNLLNAGLSQGIPQPAIQQFILNNPNAQVAGPGDLMNWWNSQDQNAWIYGNGGNNAPPPPAQPPPSGPTTSNNQVTPIAEQLMVAVQRGQMTMAQAQVIMDNYARNNPGINPQTGANQNTGTPPGSTVSPPPGGGGSLFSGPQNNAPPPATPPTPPPSNFVNSQTAGTSMHTTMGQSPTYTPTSGHNGPANYGGAAGPPAAPPPIWVGSGPDVFNTGTPQNNNTTPSLGTQSTLRWTAAGNNITANRRADWGPGSYHSRQSGSSSYTTPGQDYSRYSW